MNAFRTDEFREAGQTLVGEEAKDAGAARIRAGRNYRFGWSVAAVLGIVAIATVVRDPTAVTLVSAALYAVGAIWLFRKWRVPPVRCTAPEGSVEARVEALRAELQWARSWLLLFPIGLWYTAIFKFSAQTDYSLERFFPLVFASVRRGEGSTIAMVILCGVLAYFGWRVSRAKRQLRELEAPASI